MKFFQMHDGQWVNLGQVILATKLPSGIILHMSDGTEVKETDLNYAGLLEEAIKANE
jgi:hypothetical protein